MSDIFNDTYHICDIERIHVRLLKVHHKLLHANSNSQLLILFVYHNIFKVIVPIMVRAAVSTCETYDHRLSSTTYHVVSSISRSPQYHTHHSSFHAVQHNTFVSVIRNSSQHGSKAHQGHSADCSNPICGMLRSLSEGHFDGQMAVRKNQSYKTNFSHTMQSHSLGKHSRTIFTRNN